MSKVYILTRQVYDDFSIIGVCASKNGAEDLLEQQRIHIESLYPGCWEEGGWREIQDWTNSGARIKVRNGEAFKHWYSIEEHDLIQY